MLVAGVASRETVRLEEANRRRGMAEVVSDACCCGVVSCVTVLSALRSVCAREGDLNFISSSLSSPTVPLRPRTNREVLRPSSGSSVPARRVLSNRDDFLPSSGSSVPARRDRATRREDLRCEIGSSGVDGVEFDTREAGSEFPLRMLSLLSSNLDMARGLVFALAKACSVFERLGRR